MVIVWIHCFGSHCHEDRTSMHKWLLWLWRDVECLPSFSSDPFAMIIDPSNLHPPRPGDERFSSHNFNHSICCSQANVPWPWTVPWARVSQRWLSISIRKKQTQSNHFPSCTLEPFGSQGNRDFPMVSGQCYVHAFGFHNIPYQQVHQLFHAILELPLGVWSVWHLCLRSSWISLKARTQALAWLLVLFCVVGLVLPAAPAAPIHAGRAAGECSSWGAAAEGKWWHTTWHWWKTEWETCRCVVGDTASYPTMITPQRWSWHSAAF